MASKKDTGFKPKFSGLTTREKKWGSVRFRDYQSNYPHLHKMGQLLMLEELVFTEALHEKIKEKIEQLVKLKNDVTGSVDPLLPKSIQDALRESNEAQLRLKERLGLFENKQKLDAFRSFEELKEDFREYRRKNPNSFKCTCPSCSFIFFLKRRTDCYEEIDSPWFKDKVLYNPQLWDAYKCKEISKKRIAAVLGTSEDYIDWLAEKIFAVKKNNVSSDEPSLETLSLPVDDSSKK